jgi:hypothetical protein
MLIETNNVQRMIIPTAHNLKTPRSSLITKIVNNSATKHFDIGLQRIWKHRHFFWRAKAACQESLPALLTPRERLLRSPSHAFAHRLLNVPPSFRAAAICLRPVEGALQDQRQKKFSFDRRPQNGG